MMKERKTVAEMAAEYYPKCWGIDRMRALAEKNKLTEAEFEKITAEKYKAA